MNHHHNSAIELNESGICSLLDHNYEEAKGFFHRALLLMKEQNQSKRTLCSAASAQEDILYKSIDIEFYEPSRTNEKFLSKSGFQGPNMCKMAVCISGAASATTSTSLTSAVVYNIAVTIHLWGLQIGSTDHLQKALQLYEIVYRTHQEHGVTEPNSIKIITSTLNNVACIYTIMGNHELAAKLLHELLVIMVYCSTPGSLPPKYHDGRSWKICWCNILTLFVGPPSTAGAA